MEVFLSPEKVLSEIDLKSDMVAAEFGSGSGGFAIPLAKKLLDGLVYAIDIQEAPLSVLKARAQSGNVVNIKIVHSDLEKLRGSTLQDSALDLVFVVNVLFQAEEKENILSEAKRILKDSGRIIVVDWLPESPQAASGAKISAEALKDMAEKIGLKLEKDFNAGSYHYGLIFKK